MTAVRIPRDRKAKRDNADDVAARVVSDRAEGEAYVASVCFKHGPPRLFGVEIEYLVHDATDPALPLDPGRLARALGAHTPRTLRPDSEHTPLPSGSRLSLEPGCQVEISTAPQDSLRDLATVVTADLAYLTDLLARVGLRMSPDAIDPFREPRRVLPTPRYAAMERRFAKSGTGGVTMMCSTAALQVCLDAGEKARFADRWAAVHALGPVMLALFANSRRHAGRDTGSVSARWLAVMDTEYARTHPGETGADPERAWAARVMDTPLMVLPRDDGEWDAPDGLTFADWIAGRGAAAALAPPTTADLDYHLTTMFTPVRPQGYLEVRYLDAQPQGAWLHPVALLAALLARQSTVDQVAAVCEPVADRWADAARFGLDDAAIAEAAAAVADLGCAELAAVNLPSDTVADIAYTVQRRVRRASRGGQR
ncbi:ergothioneine biosynthesis glutamate--cysteine ligase EgtA [Prauserella marina]|uniref:Glutamate--cysteine ligase EgtA n=1 Tax=Prauserella marina TaxID=530584 RepID=A0A222VZM6_9PSEU|nr:glutamate-cysteine ligase family protein [Prauserella marina]ASR39377.1 ergothioneine biosynthesis glutamate--cysteine ligase EgtA [Prauserella marina]PWV77269.1 glutamate--cysteine ligase [Prauserella marina]SDD08252.1 glutamate--cysteine ligase [Prauserella marina]